jgi:20S proteasome subunit beta 2
MAAYMDLPTKGGFDFGLCRRNQSLAEKKGLKIPGFLKTGTTIVGLVFKVRKISSLWLRVL